MLAIIFIVSIGVSFVSLLSFYGSDCEEIGSLIVSILSFLLFIGLLVFIFNYKVQKTEYTKNMTVIEMNIDSGDEEYDTNSTTRVDTYYITVQNDENVIKFTVSEYVYEHMKVGGSVQVKVRSKYRPILGSTKVHYELEADY